MIDLKEIVQKDSQMMMNIEMKNKYHPPIPVISSQLPKFCENFDPTQYTTWVK